MNQPGGMKTKKSNYKISGVLLVAMAWLTAIAILLAVYYKFKILLH